MVLTLVVENPDLEVLKKCKDNPYGTGLQSGINIKCEHSDGHIQLVNPTENGRVLVHSGRTFGQDPINAGFKDYCSISKYSVKKDDYEKNLKIWNIFIKIVAKV